MKNKYEIRGNIVFIFLKMKNETLETIIDLENLEKAKKFKNTWIAHKNRESEGYYVRGADRGKTILLHRYLMDCPKENLVDHKNHNSLDNRKINLRIADKSINNQNMRFVKSTNSGMRGVSWNKHSKKWLIYFTVGGKRTYFGGFEDLEEAKKEALNVIKIIYPYCVLSDVI